MILFINACVRAGSRTRRLAKALLDRLEGPVREVTLSDLTFPKADQAFLDLRDDLIRRQEWDHPLFDLARQFAGADTVVVAAPCWDLSFPAMLKQYFEQVTVTGVTFRYTPEGYPRGLCRARRLNYVRTSGGPLPEPNHAYAYVRDLATGFYGIPETRLLSAAMLDVEGLDPEAILREAEEKISDIL